MTRKQLQEFSVDELRMLRHRYLADTPKGNTECSRRHRIVERINQEIDFKKTILLHERNQKRNRTTHTEQVTA